MINHSGQDNHDDAALSVFSADGIGDNTGDDSKDQGQHLNQDQVSMHEKP